MQTSFGWELAAIINSYRPSQFSWWCLTWEMISQRARRTRLSASFWKSWRRKDWTTHHLFHAFYVPWPLLILSSFSHAFLSITLRRITAIKAFCDVLMLLWRTLKNWVMTYPMNHQKKGNIENVVLSHLIQASLGLCIIQRNETLTASRTALSGERRDSMKAENSSELYKWVGQIGPHTFGSQPFSTGGRCLFLWS